MKITILDTTLRDGSYAIDFQFTIEDTILLCTLLDQAGIPLIEIGHGLGFNAGPAGKGEPAASDEEYLAAAAASVGKSMFGMFCIPGIARLSDLGLGRKYGMHFVRIGINITELDQAEPFIKQAKDLGYELVFSNLMKSYAVSPETFGECAAKAASWGADIVCLVDSAGGMLSQDVRAYLKAAQVASSVKLGFHGHDNLCLALANALEAINCGVNIIDSSIQGMGRSAGNVTTEVLVAVLKRLGYKMNISERLLQNIGDRVIRPLLHSPGRDSLAVTSGYAMFHSSFLGVIREYAGKYSVDERDLIVELCNRDKVNAPKDLVESLARQLAGEKLSQGEIRLPEASRSYFQVEEPLALSVDRLARDIHAKATKKACRSIFNIEVPVMPLSSTRLSTFVQQGFGFVIGSAQISDKKALKEILIGIDGIVDAVFLDVESEVVDDHAFTEIANQTLKKTELFIYQDSLVWAHAIRDQLLALFDYFTGRKLALFGNTVVALRLAQMVAEIGAEVAVCGWPAERLKALQQVLAAYSGQINLLAPDKAVQGAIAVVGTTPYSGEIEKDLVAQLKTKAIVLDGGIGTLAPGVVEACFQKGIRVIRVDMRAALAGEIAARMGSKKIVKEDAGRREVDGISVVAGGEVGRKGEIIVDSLTEPERVVGIADGCGNVLYEIPNEYKGQVETVWEFILKKKITA